MHTHTSTNTHTSAALVNTVMRKGDEVPEIEEDRSPLTLHELRDGIEGDYQVSLSLSLSLSHTHTP